MIEHRYKWNKAAFLHGVLQWEPSTPEMGLAKYGTLNCPSELQLEVEMADLEANRNTNEIYSKVKFMPEPQLVSLLTELGPEQHSFPSLLLQAIASPQQSPPFLAHISLPLPAQHFAAVFVCLASGLQQAP